MATFPSLLWGVDFAACVVSVSQWNLLTKTLNPKTYTPPKKKQTALTTEVLDLISRLCGGGTIQCPVLSGHFSLITVGSGFCCLRSFSQSVEPLHQKTRSPNFWSAHSHCSGVHSNIGLSTDRYQSNERGVTCLAWKNCLWHFAIM